MEFDCLVLGAGLSGLYAALQLHRRGLRCRVLEARERLGGRIFSAAPPGQASALARVDLGPAWVWPEFQPLIAGLTRELDVALFAQHTQGAALYEDAQQAPLRIEGESPNAQSYRIEGGALRLVEALASRLDAEAVLTDRRVESLTRLENGVEVCTRASDGTQRTYRAARVISSIPLRLLVQSIRFSPALPPALAQTFAATPTWMAAHAKFLAVYSQAFWRDAGLSGETFSRRGPLSEIYDASSAHGAPYALFGFFGLSAGERHRIGRQALAQASLDQLARLFGDAARSPLHWWIKDWSEDALTATSADASPPAGHPAYGLAQTQLSLWDGRLVFAGTETAPGQGGYLEGALESAMRASAQLRQEAG